ncbi:MAG: TspO/MBR family protein [Saprospiraceae bacterium]
MKKSSQSGHHPSQPIYKFIFSVALPLFIGFASGYITKNEISGVWFTSLQKPSFNPPNIIFFPVWTTLYILMGISMFLIWITVKTPLRQKALLIFGVQLFLNFWWSILFFSFHSFIVSILVILLLWILIIYIVKLFRPIKPAAAFLQIPYLLWITFATLLNISFYILNKP